MASKHNRPDNAAGLRKRAEEILRDNALRWPENLDALSSEKIRRMFHELHVHQVELELQNEELRRTQADLEVARARYFNLFDRAPVGNLTVSENGLILEANLAAAAMLDVAKGLLLKQPLTRYVLSDDQDILYLHRKQLFETGKPVVCDLRMVKKDGIFWVRLEGILAIETDGARSSHIVISDITARKQIEESLQEYNCRLEQLVKEKTQDLISKNKRLEDVNTALNVILQKRNEDMRMIEKKVLLNVNELIDPLIMSLKNSGLDENQSAYVDTLESFLKEIVSPFSHTLKDKFNALSLTEIRVANLIKKGKTTKDIAGILNSTPRTIDFHRQNIRKKTGLTKHRVTLATHLLSFLE